MPYLFFYNLFLSIYHFGIRLASIQNKKAKLWIAGRRNWKNQLDASMANLRKSAGPDTQRIWMHCSSLGEFEQGRPVIEKLRSLNPDLQVVISFFSPSGYEVVKNFKSASLVCYLPLDSALAARHFVNTVAPGLVLWVKYEYWYYYLKELRDRKIPVLLISGIFRKDQPFFKWHGKLQREMLQFFSFLFVQNQASAVLAGSVTKSSKIVVSGDTRFDRVVEIAEKFAAVPLVEKWLGDSAKVLVAGSTWDEDEKELVHYVKQHPGIKFIIAPHNINEEEIKENLQLFPGAVLYSLLEKNAGSQAAAAAHILIIDNVGLLARLYHYATVTYVGGGFGDDGVHNVLEAAVYGKPVVHGPEYDKYAEARGLIEAGGAIEIEDALALENVLNRLFSDTQFYASTGTAAGKFVYENQGATAKIVNHIYKNRLLTS